MNKQLLENPLLLVIDMQNVYSNGQKWECSNFDRSLNQIKKLLESNPEEKIIFTKYIASDAPQGIWKSYNIENSDVNSDKWLNELVDDFKELQKEYKCYSKSVYSSYSIEQIKKAASDASCVVVTGVVAECCVLSTVMSLIDAGVYVIYLKDSVAGVNNETEEATIKVLEGLAPLHLSIMTTEEYLQIKLN